MNEANHIRKEDYVKIKVVERNVKIKKDQFKIILEGMRERFKKGETVFAQFSDVRSLTNKLCLDYTGFTKDEFTFILNELKSLKPSPSRSKEQALAIYLTYLKTGLPQNTIAAIFGLNLRQQVSNFCAQVRDAFMKDFVPFYLGPAHLTRENWLQKNTLMVQQLFN